jgi:hypothetical protein
MKKIGLSQGFSQEETSLLGHNIDNNRGNFPASKPKNNP